MVIPCKDNLRDHAFILKFKSDHTGYRHQAFKICNKNFSTQVKTKTSDHAMYRDLGFH